MISVLAQQMNCQLTAAADKIKANILANMQKEIAAKGGDINELKNGGVELQLSKNKYADVTSYVKINNEIQELIYMGKV